MASGAVQALFLHLSYPARVSTRLDRSYLVALILTAFYVLVLSPQNAMAKRGRIQKLLWLDLGGCVRIPLHPALTTAFPSTFRGAAGSNRLLQLVYSNYGWKWLGGMGWKR